MTSFQPQTQHYLESNSSLLESYGPMNSLYCFKTIWIRFLLLEMKKSRNKRRKKKRTGKNRYTKTDTAILPSLGQRERLETLTKPCNCWKAFNLKVQSHFRNSCFLPETKSEDLLLFSGQKIYKKDERIFTNPPKIIIISVMGKVNKKGRRKTEGYSFIKYDSFSGFKLKYIEIGS